METTITSSNLLLLKMKIVKELGCELDNKSVILDFGCGSGKMVQELRDLGYEAYGCGTRFIYPKGIDTEGMLNRRIIRQIDIKDYKLPFESNSFDFIFSHSVFEHVRNYSESISEIARVLKPSGYCIHFFPPRYGLLEAHVYVPFSSVFHPQPWLQLWTTLGVRNEWTKNMDARNSAAWFHNYLEKETNYLRKDELLQQFKSQFSEVRFCEDMVLKFSEGKGKYLYAISRFIPFIPQIYSSFRLRAVFTRLPKKAGIALEN
jgi:ubiquinone/menaquinone biosynthesis C-methylase UbiE